MGMRSFLGSIRFRIVAIYLIVMVLAFVAISGVVGELVKGFLVSQRTLAQLSDTEHLALAIAPLYEK
ncbi:MAG TPA: hypothetical protein PLE79_06705, partial [Clostridia bacterium]|nr:hypothetical protein [Clostridia bacterium]